MTAYEVITLADALAPNVFSDDVKLFDLNRLEQRIRVDVLQEDPEDVEPFTAGDLTAQTSRGSSAEREDDDPPSGDEIENPGTGEETGENDPPSEGSDEGSGEGSDEGSGSGGSDAGSGDSDGSDDEDDDTDDAPASGTLALPERYRDVYVFWMISMYYYHMGEYEEYQNKKAMFDDIWDRFVRDVCDQLHQGTGGEEYVKQAAGSD